MHFLEGLRILVETSVGSFVKPLMSSLQDMMVYTFTDYVREAR